MQNYVQTRLENRPLFRRNRSWRKFVIARVSYKLDMLIRLTPRYFSTSVLRNGLAAESLARAEKLSSDWKGTSATGGTTKNFIAGQFVESDTSSWTEILDPSTQTLLSKVPQTTEAEFQQAVDAASDAYRTWSRTSVLGRQRFAMELQQLLRKHADSIASSIVLEQGKTFAGLFPTSFRCPSVTLFFGKTLKATCCVVFRSWRPPLESPLPSSAKSWKVRFILTYHHKQHCHLVSKDMDTYVRKVPLGVCARSA